MPKDSFHTYTTAESRALDLRLTIDPGFVHKRRIQTVIGDGGISVIDKMIADLPDAPEWMREVRIDHIYTRVMLDFCRVHEIKTLEQTLMDQRGDLFCSTLHVEPYPEFYDVDRATSVWTPSFPFEKPVEFQYATQRVRADTLKSRLHEGCNLSVVGLFAFVEEHRIVFDPLIMGFPWLETDDPKWRDKVMWWGNRFYENYLEDFDEFAQVANHAMPEDFSAMKDVPEIGFKRAIAKILGDEIRKDWGGETSDHFTSQLHLCGRRVNAAFLLKGPAKFGPMTIRHLGKNGDQIVRLAQEPADVLFVQHCHEITPAVRTMLRAFVVQPGRPRRYCCVDGRESLRLLNAFNLLDFARSQEEC